MSNWLVIALRSREVRDIQMEMLRKTVWKLKGVAKESDIT